MNISNFFKFEKTQLERQFISFLEMWIFVKPGQTEIGLNVVSTGKTIDGAADTVLDGIARLKFQSIIVRKSFISESSCEH